jgi:hypothetical protein
MDQIQPTKVIYVSDLIPDANINKTNETSCTNDENEIIEKKDEKKSIVFTGTTTKYQMKKIDPIKKEKKKRVETDTWGLDEIQLSFDTQLEILKNIHSINELKTNKLTKTNKTNNVNKYSSLIVSHIKNKISSYKQQDILKNIFLESDFVSYDTVIQLLNDCNLKCYYCSCETFLLYEFVREMKQWSLDLINNDIGHNKNNLIISCLECNLKRRRTNKDSFMFTKNLKISREGF